MRRNFKIVGFDTETVDGKPYSFQFYSNELNLNHFLTDFDEVRKLMLSIPAKTHFYSANVEFDFFFLRKVLGSSWSCMMFRNGNQWIKGKLISPIGRIIHFHDVFRLFPYCSLKMIGEIIGLKKLEKPDFLGKREPKTVEEMKYFKEYAMRDAEICYFAPRYIHQKVGMLRNTIGSLSKAYFEKHYYKEKKYFRSNDELEIRLRYAYKGGRTECFKRGSTDEKLKLYDVNSLYPYVMANSDFPAVEEPRHKNGDLNLDKYGIAYVEVESDADIPLLGIRHLCYDKCIRLVFPNGRFRDHFTYPELFQLEKTECGKILKVYEAWEISSGDYFFNEFMHEFYKRKEKAVESKDPVKYVWKTMMNSLYGKFAELGRGTWFVLHSDGKAEKVNDGKKKKDVRKNNIFWAAYITSYARIYLWEILKRCGSDKIYYCDTDSVITSRNLETGKYLGQMKLSAESDDSIFIRSKFYHFAGKLRMVGFDAPISANSLRILIMSKNYEIPQHRMMRLLEALRRHQEPFKYMEINKRFNPNHDGKRIYEKHNVEDITLQLFNSEPLEIRGRNGNIN